MILLNVCPHIAARRRRKTWDTVREGRSGRSSPDFVSGSDSASDGDIEPWDNSEPALEQH